MYRQSKSGVLKTYAISATLGKPNSKHRISDFIWRIFCLVILAIIPLMSRSDSSLDSSSDFSGDSDADYRLAQKEWDESVEELQQLALVLLLPWVGKYLGRRYSYWRMLHSIIHYHLTKNVSRSVRPLHPCRSWQIIFYRRETFGVVLLLAMTESMMYYKDIQLLRCKPLVLTSSSMPSVVEFYPQGPPMPQLA